MDTEVPLGQQQVPGSVTVRSAEESGGCYSAAIIEQMLHTSIDDSAKSSDTTESAPSLAEGFAGIVYFSDMAADSQGERRSPRHRPGAGVSGVESVRSARGRRTPARPWRLPAVNRQIKS